MDWFATHLRFAIRLGSHLAQVHEYTQINTHGWNVRYLPEVFNTSFSAASQQLWNICFPYAQSYEQLPLQVPLFSSLAMVCACWHGQLQRHGGTRARIQWCSAVPGFAVPEAVPFVLFWSYWPSGDSLENLNLLVCVSVLTAHLWTESLMLCQWSWPGIVWQQVYGSCVQQVGRAFLDLFSFPCRSWYPFGKQELIWILDIPHTSS